MTKVISLSERAYRKLSKVKRPNESFSDTVLRISGERGEKKSLLDFAGSWKGGDIEEVFSIVRKDRKASTSRKFEL
jgi:predicted CopG family antitoxin